MTSLFSSFDSKIFLLFYFLMFFFYSFYSYKTMFFFSSFVKIFNSSMKFLLDFFGSLSMFNSYKGLESFLLFLLFFLFSMNIFSIFPYNFALTSQVGFILPLSIICFLSLMSISFKSNMKGQISHFIPEGSPYPLVPFLFLIEIVSSLIRPLTLTVRLLANILAGHLLIILLSGMVNNYFLFFPLLSLLNSVELFVALIQSYIFSTLVSLYMAEI